MAAIDIYLQQILDAVYGEEVRGSIHDSIAAMNVESTNAEAAAISAQNSAQNSATTATSAKDAAIIARDEALQAAADARQYATGAMRYRGTVAFANLPTSGNVTGDYYNISDAFTADNKFRPEDVGKECKPGTNVAYDENGKWDISGSFSGGGLPSGGKTGQMLVKQSQTDGDAVWSGGIYSCSTISEMNAKIQSGDIPNNATVMVEENSGANADILNDLDDVEITDPANNQVLKYNALTHLWENGNAAAEITVDSALSTLSENPVRNSVITNALAGGRIRFGIDASGNYGYIKDGADTVTPFRRGIAYGSRNIGIISPKTISRAELINDGYIIGDSNTSDIKIPTIRSINGYIGGVDSDNCLISRFVFSVKNGFGNNTVFSNSYVYGWYINDEGYVDDINTEYNYVNPTSTTKSSVLLYAVVDRSAETIKIFAGSGVSNSIAKIIYGLYFMYDTE